MNTLLYIIIVTFSGSMLRPMHDVPIAVFRISDSDDHIALEVTFDSEDLSQALNIAKDKIEINLVQSYILNNTSFKFDNMSLQPSLIDMTTLKDHVRFSGVFIKNPKNIKSLQIANSCLIDVSSHSNIMMINLNNTIRDFRMHKGRKNIKIEY